jgi:hypothetical protein
MIVPRFRIASQKMILDPAVEQATKKQHPKVKALLSKELTPLVVLGAFIYNYGGTGPIGLLLSFLGLHHPKSPFQLVPSQGASYTNR